MASQLPPPATPTASASTTPTTAASAAAAPAEAAPATAAPAEAAPAAAVPAAAASAAAAPAQTPPTGAATTATQPAPVPIPGTSPTAGPSENVVLANKPGEPAFQMKIDLEKLEFKSDKLDKEPVKVELNIENTTGKRQTLKVKCTSNEWFRVRPPLTFIGAGETAKIMITFQSKEVPEPNIHFFAFLHMSVDDKATQPRALWTPTSKPEGVKRLPCLFKKMDGTVWSQQK